MAAFGDDYEIRARFEHERYCACCAGRRRAEEHIAVLRSELDRLCAERRWIPVGERKPKDQEVVLVWWLKADWGPKGMVPGAVRGRYIASLNQWRPSGGSGDFSKEITHWMPLPEPPGETATPTPATEEE